MEFWRSGVNQRVSRMNGNTQFVGLSVIFGESVGINVWPLVASVSVSLKRNRTKTRWRQMQRSSFGWLFVIRRLFSFGNKRQNYQDKQKTYKKNPGELKERASVQKCAV